MATRKMPSPRSEMVIPVHRRRKSRWRRGARRLTREKPPGRSSASWLCCMRPSLVGRLLVLVEVREERLVCHRLCEEEALTEVAAEVPKRRDLFRELDSLRHDVEVERRAERDDRRDQPGLLVLAREERAVHLEDVDRE